MSYLGYRLIVESTTISKDLVQKGTYKFKKVKRIAAKWEDARKIEHQQVLTNRKVVISFSLRQRSLAEQESIKGLFAKSENISVTYWDDYDCEYKTGTFYMNEPELTHLNATPDINYAATNITLTEY